MKEVALTLPTLGFVVGTRAALAFGLGLLLADHIPPVPMRQEQSADATVDRVALV